ncbi:MAG: GTPase Era [Bernardetiaceae bacterium]|jgi:GTP-binding protein Era|nr:GTPase Era [Bernardetiaceae bacterium]
MAETTHRAGFANIIGKPNVGKSTLMNALTGERLSIITAKAQTTRHRIMGILSGEDFQVIYSDTPGILKPAYELHKVMMTYVDLALDDADILIYVVEVGEGYDEELPVLKRLQTSTVPLIVVINKIDLASQEAVMEKIKLWEEKLNPRAVIPVSALNNFNTEALLQTVRDLLPPHPPYFDKEEMTDRTERFFASEIIREKIFLHYEQEIPYSSDVVIDAFQELDHVIRIRALILVERDSQKGIIIGRGGAMLKKIGIEARKAMEAFFGKPVYLEQHVKVEPDWRNQKNKLERLGYGS